LVLLFIGCIQSCSTEESLLENDAAIKTVTKEEAIQFLKKQETTVSISSKNATLNFNFNKITQEKLTNTSELLTVVPTTSTTKNKKTCALLVKINNNIETILYNEYPYASSTKNNFNGVILMTKLNGDFIRSYRLKNNDFDVELAPTKGSKTNKLFSSKDIIAMEELNEVIVINNYKKPKYKYVPMEFKAPTVSTEEDFYWLKTGGGGEAAEEVEEEIARKISDSIDDSELDECPKDVMSKLKYSGNLDIAFVLQSLGASTDYKVNFVMKPAKSYAETQRTSKYNYEIRVDRTQSTDGTKLFKATVLLHEIIHAHFLSIVDYYNSTPTTLFSLQTSFPDLFEAYVKSKYPNSTDKEDAQHKEMAEKYVEAMAMTLQQYDANFITNYQVYKDLAWGSLKDTPIFSKTYLPGSDESKRISNRYKAEALGRAVDQGTPNEQAPVGKPCD
jgi:hypothetical protein